MKTAVSKSAKRSKHSRDKQPNGPLQPESTRAWNAQLSKQTTAHNKTSEDVHKKAVSHIKRFPKIESHYCRSETKREYIDPALSIHKMHDLYLLANPTNPIGEFYYCKIFNGEFNIGFHKPSKDACDTCDIYAKRKQLQELDGNLEAQQAAHLRQKAQAYSSKSRDKEATQGTLAACFDLQQVLRCPKLFAGSTYYKRKLNIYNLTFYELQTKKGACYMWSESEAHRGANDIATAVVKYLEKIDQTAEYDKVILYSDTCGGQQNNHNSYHIVSHNSFKPLTG